MQILSLNFDSFWHDLHIQVSFPDFGEVNSPFWTSDETLKPFKINKMSAILLKIWRLFSEKNEQLYFCQSFVMSFSKEHNPILYFSQVSS